MDFRPLTILPLLALLAAGCASSPDLAPLERENRLLEDRVYQLEDELDRHCDLVDSYTRENEQLREKLKANGSDDTPFSPPKVDLGTPAARLSPARRRLSHALADANVVPALATQLAPAEHARRPPRRPAWSPDRPGAASATALRRPAPTWTPQR